MEKRIWTHTPMFAKLGDINHNGGNYGVISESSNPDWKAQGRLLEREESEMRPKG